MTDRCMKNLAAWNREKIEYLGSLNRTAEQAQGRRISVAESRKMIQRLLESFHGPAVMVDGKGMVEYCNSYMLWLFGTDSGDLLGREFIAFCQPAESRNEITAAFEGIYHGTILESDVLCKLTISAQSVYLIDWKVTSLPGAKVIVLFGYNIGDYKPMHNFDPIVAPFTPPGVFIVQDGKFKFWNCHISEYSGMSEEEMIDYDFFKIVHPEDVDTVRKYAADMLKGKDKTPYEYRYINKRGETRWAMEVVLPVVYGGRRAALGYVMDITEKKNMLRNLQESENIYHTIFENSGTAMIMFDSDGMITMANKEALLLSGYNRRHMNYQVKWTDFVSGEDRERLLYYHQSRSTGENIAPRSDEFKLIRRDGTIRNVFYTISIIPGTSMWVGSLIDITARREAEDKLKFLSTHDKLTGLYNRAFFEEQLEAVRGRSTAGFSLIGCDIDGLKLINDAFGHVAGDGILSEVARILGKCVRKGDVVARTGGDEFAVLMRKAGYAEVQAVCSAIRQSVKEHNDKDPTFPLSVSLGFAVAEHPGDNPYDLLKLADNNMYREKLLHGQSVRSNIVQIAMKALGERDFITEGHAERLRHIVGRMAAAFGQDISNAADMILLAEFHDIGKVGIPDHILFKRGPLTREEYVEMQRHCEIGQRIALSSPDLAPIADWILKHHERWDGNGYPLRLKGEEIPLACRILAIADSYDAMTSDRPYRRALGHEDALAEILRCSGSQFDPGVVRVFVQIFDQSVTG